MKCQICYKHEADSRDYRFIDSCGLQGKVYACNWCINLNDDAIKEIVGEKADPKDYYNWEDEEMSNAGKVNF